jgi:N-acetylglucosamine repressor
VAVGDRGIIATVSDHAPTASATVSERLVYEHFLYRLETTIPDLSAKLSIPSSTVVGLVSKLERKGLVTKVDTARGGKGRPKIVYQVCLPFPTLVCALDGTAVSCASFNRDLSTTSAEKKDLEEIVTADVAVSEIRELVGRSRTKLPAMEHPEVALSVNAVISPKGVITSTVLPFIAELSESRISELCGFPVRFVPSPHLLAEYHELPEPAPDNFCLFHVGDGVSAHAVVNGRIARGTLAMAGEVGHIARDSTGVLCHCGKRGCLEASCSGPAIVRSVVDDLKTGVVSCLSLRELEHSPAERAIESIWKGWLEDDTYLRNRMEAIFDFLAWGLGTVVVLYDPEVMALGGYLFEGKQEWADEVLRRLSRWVFNMKQRTTEYRLASSRWLDVLKATALLYHDLLVQ